MKNLIKVGVGKEFGFRDIESKKGDFSLVIDGEEEVYSDGMDFFVLNSDYILYNGVTCSRLRSWSNDDDQIKKTMVWDETNKEWLNGYSYKGVALLATTSEEAYKMLQERFVAIEGYNGAIFVKP